MQKDIQESFIILDFQKPSFPLKKASTLPPGATISEHGLIFVVGGEEDCSRYIIRTPLASDGILEESVIVADDADDPEDPLREIEPLFSHYLLSSGPHRFLLVYFETHDSTQTYLREVEILIQEIDDHNPLRHTLLHETWTLPVSHGVEPSILTHNEQYLLFVIEKNIFLFDRTTHHLEMLFEAYVDGFRDFFSLYFYQNKAYFTCYYTRGSQQGCSLYCYDTMQRSIQRIYTTQDWVPLHMVETSENWLFLCTTDADRYQHDKSTGLMVVEMSKKNHQPFKVTSLVKARTSKLDSGISNVNASYDTDKDAFVFLGRVYMQTPEHLSHFAQTHQITLSDKLKQIPSVYYPLALYLIGTYHLDGKTHLYFLSDFIHFYRTTKQPHHDTDKHYEKYPFITQQLYYGGYFYFFTWNGSNQKIARHKVQCFPS